MDITDAVTAVDDNMGAVKRQLAQNQTTLSGEDQAAFDNLDAAIQNLMNVLNSEETQES